jgi:hypothetical protein
MCYSVEPFKETTTLVVKGQFNSTRSFENLELSSRERLKFSSSPSSSKAALFPGYIKCAPSMLLYVALQLHVLSVIIKSKYTYLKIFLSALRLFNLHNHSFPSSLFNLWDATDVRTCRFKIIITGLLETHVLV